MATPPPAAHAQPRHHVIPPAPPRPPLSCSARTFNVEFSPLVKHWLLSSSNDRTARVWDVSTGDCQTVLQGHTAEVRAVAWHPEVAHICFTGSQVKEARWG